MKTIISSLEDNIFSGILVKKGLTRVRDKDFELLRKTREFKTAVNNGFIRLVTADVAKPNVPDKPNFDTMSYAELKQYVTDNNITVASMKKVDILNALKGE